MTADATAAGDVDTEVLIVGAGPTGLTLAIELARRGVDHRLIEREDDSVETSRAISIQPRTLQLFADLGVLDAVLEEGVRVGGLTGYRGADRLFRLDADVVDAPYPYLWHLPQNRTERLLRARLRDLGGRVEFERELVGFGQDRAAVTATVRHRDGDTDPERGERIRARWLVGADGGSSRVRRTLGVPFEGSTRTERFLVADARMEWDRPADEAGLWFHGDGLFVAFPMPGGRWRLFADVSDYPEGGRPDASVGTFERLRRERTDAEGTIRGADWTSEFVVNQRLVPAYRHGRAFLAGDAAHVHVPLGGVGMNTGVQDAYNLGWKLALVADGAAPDALLDTYGAERRPIAADVVDSTGPSIGVLSSDGRLVRLLRDRVGATLLDAGRVQRRILRADTQLDVSYRGGPLASAYEETPLSALAGDLPTAVRDTWRAPRAGDRAPEADLHGPGGPTSVHRELRGPTVTVFGFAGTTARPAEDDATLATVRRVATVAARAGVAVDARLVVPTGREWTREREPDVAVGAGEAGEGGGGGDASGNRVGDVAVVRDPSGAAHRRYGAVRSTLFVVRPDDYLGVRAQPARAAPAVDYLRERLTVDVEAPSAATSAATDAADEDRDEGRGSEPTPSESAGAARMAND